jgi:glycosyltransferase involved in cell wall biosynthesis
MSTKLRIAVIGQVFPIKGGISHYNSLLINEFLAAGADILAISFIRIFPRWLHPLKTNKDGESKNFFKGSAEFIFDIPRPGSWLKVISRILEYRPDAILVHWYTPLLAVPLWFVLRRIRRALPATKIIAICHNVVPHERIPFDRWLTKKTFALIDCAITHSERDALAAATWIPGVMVKKLFHPVYDFFPRNITQGDARKILGVSGNVVLFFGGIRSYKGLSYLLRAIQRVSQKIPITLLIAGEFFGGKERYLRLMKELHIEDKVKIFDRYIPNEEVGTFFSASDVVAAPYISGTQSGAINVALAFEKPIIATDVGGFGEIVKNGETGYLVPPRDSDAFADALVTFFSLPRLSFSEGMKKIQQAHSWKNLSVNILKLMEELRS